MKTRQLMIWPMVALLAVAGLAPASAGPPKPGGHHGAPVTVAELNSPRGVDALGRGKTLVTEGDGSFSLVIERHGRPARTVRLGAVAAGSAPAIARGRDGTIFVLTGAAGPGQPGGALYRWRPGWSEPRLFADIAAYQAGDPDPYDLEDNPEESNPYGIAALKDGGVLVADAAGNDLLHVSRKGRIHTVAHLKPRTVEVPEGLPDVPEEEGGPLPPAGTPIPSEAVPTSVTVGPDGAWYVGELRGFPATPGTSQIWRIKPHPKRVAVCDPERPHHGTCTRYADGLTSLVDLAADRHSVYALTLSKASWLALELGAPGSEVGGLYRLTRGYGGVRSVELAAGALVLPGGVDVSDAIYVTGPIFGPGQLQRLRR